jgi:hypothetical protein
MGAHRWFNKPPVPMNGRIESAFGGEQSVVTIALRWSGRL